MVKEHVQKLSSALWQLQRSGRFCDTVLVVSGNVEIQAHAAVLAATSVQLCAMLQQNQSDDAQNRGTCPYYLDVIDYDMSTVAALLEFIYIGEMSAFTSLTWSSRNHMIELCMKFGITVTDNSADNMQFPKYVVYYKSLVLCIYSFLAVILCYGMFDLRKLLKQVKFWLFSQTLYWTLLTVSHKNCHFYFYDNFGKCRQQQQTNLVAFPPGQCQ